MEVDLLVTGGTVVTANEAGEIIHDGLIAVAGGVIVHVGPRAEAPVFAATTTLDAAGHVVTPGLIDAHLHPTHFLSKGLADDMDFQRRSYERVWPYELALTDEEAELSSKASFLEMISNGTTCFSDPGSYYPDATARAAIAVGIRGIVGREICDVLPEGAPPEILEDRHVALADAIRVAETWNNYADGLIRAKFSVIRPTTVSDDLCRAIRDVALKMGVGIQGHLITGGESGGTSSLVTGVGGALKRYDEIGLLDAPMTLVHLGPLTAEERRLFVDRHISAVHCPSASMLGGFGIISHGNIPELVADGVAVGLGSDAGAISRFLDMVRVAYLAACGHKDARRDPEIMGADVAFKMATIDGARALGWSDSIGSLEVGKNADIVVFDTSGPEWHPNPLARPVANLIYSGSGRNARDVVIAGSVVLRDFEFVAVDVAEILAKTDEAAPRVRARIGIS